MLQFGGSSLVQDDLKEDDSDWFATLSADLQDFKSELAGQDYLNGSMFEHSNSLFKRQPDEMRSSFLEICQEHGFHMEEHRIRTEDGYFLKLFRIS